MFAENMTVVSKSHNNHKLEESIRWIIEYNYLTNIDGSNSIIKKPGKSTLSAKCKLCSNNIFDKLVLIIYRLRDSQYAR